MSETTPGEAVVDSVKPHLRSLEGIRAVSILAVIGFHCGWPGFRGGFLGVDIFFVLSGYLIGNLILKEWETSGRFSVYPFLLRRAFRLLPVMFMGFVIAGVCWAYAPAEFGRDSYWNSVLANTLLGGNFAHPHLGLLRHYWSLTIEWQFYLAAALLFPLALSRGRKWAFKAGVVLLLAIVGVRTAGYHFIGPFNPYTFSFFRFDALLVGVLVALQPEILPQWLLRLVLWVCLVSLTVAMAIVPYVWTPLYWGGFTLFALGAGVVVMNVIRGQGNRVSKVLSCPPLVYLGTRSYGLYVYHYILLRAFPSVGWLPLLVLVFVLTELSYRFLESPLREFGRKLSKRNQKASWGGKGEPPVTKETQ